MSVIPKYSDIFLKIKVTSASGIELTKSYLLASTKRGVFFNSSSKNKNLFTYSIKNSSYLEVYNRALSEESITYIIALVLG